ncbi:class II aldolase/adducin family protein [Chloroflexota bacterium]
MIYGQALLQRELVWGSSGNISSRTDSNKFVISASGSDLGLLLDDDLIPCKIDQKSHEGLRQPSMEVGLHRNIYRSCEKANAVIHTQPFYSTVVACSNLDVRTDLLPEAMAYLKHVTRVPYHHAGSGELADAVAAAAVESRVLILNNHGVVCWGSSLGEAFIATETLELLCRIAVTARAGDINMNYLGKDTMQDFVDSLEKDT